MRIGAVMLNTFREALRDKVLLSLVAIAIIVTGASKLIPPLAIGEGAKIVKDLGLATMTLFGVLIAILVGGRLVYLEIEKRTILTMIAKPVRRWEFLLGKYWGLMLVLIVSIAVMTVWFGLFMLLSGTKPDARLLLAVGMLILELGIVTAIAVLFSTFVTPISSAVFTFAIYFMGNMSRDLLNLVTQSKSVVVKVVAHFLYYILPNLQNLDVRAAVVHGQPVAPLQLALGISYALVYTTAVLLLAVFAFERRNF